MSIEKLREFCTDREWQILSEYSKLDVELSGRERQRRVGAKLGVTASRVKNCLSRVRHKSSIEYDDIESILMTMANNPELNGVSAMIPNNHGKPTWLKFKRENGDVAKALELMAEGFKEKLPKHPATPPPKIVNGDLLAQYTITDFHLGMLADAEETGGKWNIKLAEKMLIDWFKATMSMTPNTEQAVFMQIGDFLHWDGLKAVTPAHGHVLDADSRYQKLVRSCIRVTRQIMNLLLEKHGKVHCIFAEGNHDESGSSWMREWLDVFYEHEPRITVDTSIDPYYGFKFGNVGVFAHHGHKKKKENLPEVFAAKFREIMFSCEYNYAHCGHMHHKDVKESSLMIVTQHQALAAPDAHASSGGWMSQRGATATIYHKKHGYMTEYNVTPAMLGYEEVPRRIYTLNGELK